ncbi:hypothetical protein FU139_08440 [Burkholderia territorii]|nr:hypothetical protein FU139_08440 [Burkholderia territorii]
MPARRYLGPSHLDVSVVASTWSLRKTPGNYCPSAIACGTRTLRRALRSDRSAWPSTRSCRAAISYNIPATLPLTTEPPRVIAAFGPDCTPYMYRDRPHAAP